MSVVNNGKICGIDCNVYIQQESFFGVKAWGGKALIKCNYENTIEISAEIHKYFEIPLKAKVNCSKHFGICVLTSVSIDPIANIITVRFVGEGELLNMADQQETDYTGCYEEVAESLKRGQHIVVSVCFIDHPLLDKDTIYAYVANDQLPYKGLMADYNNKTCRPIQKTEKRVLGIVDMAKALAEREYKLDGYGDWRSKSHKEWFTSCVFSSCGKICNDKYTFGLPEWMTETVEVIK